MLQSQSAKIGYFKKNTAIVTMMVCNGMSTNKLLGLVNWRAKDFLLCLKQGGLVHL